MNGLSEGIAEAIAYIEENLAEEIDVSAAAEKAHLSVFYFQKIFGALCGVTVGEYIRNRRLSLAAQELSARDVKVIDVALKYGYDSPDSFARAFARFHGVSPSAAREAGCRLSFYAPLKIKLTLEGGTMLEYRIEKKEQFTLMGVSRRFNSDTSYEQIPLFWKEHMQSDAAGVICGMYGVCVEHEGKEFDYLIADNYLPWNDVPPGFVTHVVPAGTWAIFPCRGALPKALQDVNTRIWSEWLPARTEYALAGRYNLEVYIHPGDNTHETYSEIWIPVRAAEHA